MRREKDQGGGRNRGVGDTETERCRGMKHHMDRKIAAYENEIYKGQLIIHLGSDEGDGDMS